MPTFFTSDLHFGHDNIIDFCGRPFQSVSEMNRELTRCWNDVVARNDTVYVLGDFAMGNPDLWTVHLKKLNGTKILVRGNHDKGPEFMKSAGFVEVHDNIVVAIDGVQFWMHHYPIDNSGDRRGYRRPEPPAEWDVALCGHVHEHWKVNAGCVNVGVDVWDFTPITTQQILDAIIHAAEMDDPQ